MLIYDNIEGNEYSELQQFRFHNASTASSPTDGANKKGLVRFSTSAGDNRAYYWDGTAWIKFGGAAVPGDITLANGLFIVGNGSGVGAATAKSAIALSGFGNPTADISMNGFKLTSLAEPTSPGDAATKNYVDLAVQGLDAKGSCRVRTTAALTATYSSGAGTLTATSNVALPAQDGVTLTVGDRILVANQANSFENGIYVVQDAGGAGYAAWILIRATDANLVSELVSAFTFIEEGTLYANTGWVQTIEPVSFSTGTQVWTQFSGAGSYSAGNGITFNGTVINFFANSYTAGDTWYASNATTLTRVAIGAANRFSYSTGTAPAWSAYSMPAAGSTLAANGILFASSTTQVGQITTANSGVLVTNVSGVPSIATDIPTAVTIGSAYIYRSGGTDISLADGGTNASLTASTGGIVYSTASALAIAAAGTTGHFVRWNSAGAPTAHNLFGTTNTWTIQQTFDTGTSQTIALLLDKSSAGLTTAGARSSDFIQLVGQSHNGTTLRTSRLRMANMTSTGNTNEFRMEEQIDAGSWEQVFALSKGDAEFGKLNPTATGDTLFSLSQQDYNLLSVRGRFWVQAAWNTAVSGSALAAELRLDAGTSSVDSGSNHGDVIIMAGGGDGYVTQGRIFIGIDPDVDPLQSMSKVRISGACGANKILGTNASGDVVESALFSQTNTWSGLNNFTAATTAIRLLAGDSPEDSFTSSPQLLFTSNGTASGPVTTTADWRLYSRADDASGGSTFLVQHRTNANAFTTKLEVGTNGAVALGGSQFRFNRGAATETLLTCAATTTRSLTLPDASGTIALTTGSTFGASSVWNGTVIDAQYGGTGVNNSGKTITLGGNLVTSGAFALTLTLTGATNVTLPTSGTLVNSAVTTLSSLVSVGTITTGTWNATVIGTQYGGTGANLSSGATGGVVWKNGASTMTVTAAGSANQPLISSGATIGWAGFALPASVAANQLLYGSSGTQISALATVANRVLSTDGSGNLGWTGVLNVGRNTANGIARKWSNLVAGDATNVYIAIAHNLNTRDVVVGVRQASSGDATTVREMLYQKVEIRDANTVWVYFNRVQTASDFYVVTVIG